MAYSGKLISIRPVIERAFMEAGLDNIDWDFALEATGLLFGLIGIPDVYVTKTTNGVDIVPVEVVDYRATLPVDLVTLTSMRKAELDNEGLVIRVTPMVENSSLYFQTNLENESNYPNVIDPETGYPINSLDEYDDLVSSEGVLVGEGISASSGFHNYEYKVENNIVFTNFKDGYLEIVYKGYPLDVDGFPLIPDDEKFKDALKYDLIYKLDWKRWRANPASPGLKAVLNDSEQRRDWAVGAARTKARIPSVDRMEALKNMSVRLIPKFNEHGNGFSTLNKQEIRYNNRRRR